MYKLKIISSTVRPGRKGPIVAQWIAGIAGASGNFEVEILDLGEINLPLMNEAVHPIMKQYEHEHTKRWSAKIEEADAFIFVTAEYDYSYPASLKNALEYLVHEWAYKAAGIVSYSAGAFAGVRGVMSLKSDLLSLKTIGLGEMVNIPLVHQFINEENQFVADEKLEKAANLMLSQLVRWTKGLKVVKEG
ncbi:NADPH-dependent FMN reductase [Mucilaginibacter sp. L3T2-6]|uniref:NADPH-dependent FMN reductase n=1 Tax=Mucilaginibacter sp. L3T2-6 TaxID=3062491 RepID=UPI0026763080|nr:NAD(P)H-dependent oxidoreductase [Mucilaginibacter sp. L3T2-6]MDO3644118.1 NAD(P)H-dependent oxidoreductase [Mucilaginibacter sp. L3T2-6]MDV6216601.1 NAD(P)H-dependent oxidoreductase [Mucilaginibacter sp. L3T2-6]